MQIAIPEHFLPHLQPLAKEEPLESFILKLIARQMEFEHRLRGFRPTGFEDRINLTTLQAVLRYKLFLEDPQARLDFEYRDDEGVVIISVNGQPTLTGNFVLGYTTSRMRALSILEELTWIPPRHLDKPYLPVTHQSHLLNALYLHPLIGSATSTKS